MRSPIADLDRIQRNLEGREHVELDCVREAVQELARVARFGWARYVDALLSKAKKLRMRVMRRRFYCVVFAATSMVTTQLLMDELVWYMNTTLVH